MSAVRLLLLLLLAGVLCAECVATDPTAACLDVQGDNSWGGFLPVDAGFYNVQGFVSVYSETLNVLCAIRVAYEWGPSGVRFTYGPWHGNSTVDTHAAQTGGCGSTLIQYFSNVNDVAATSSGAFETRVNSATGKTVIISYTAGSTCNHNQFICAGNCYPDSKTKAAMLRDPTYRKYYFNASSPSTAASSMASPIAGPATNNNNVVTRYNFTWGQGLVTDQYGEVTLNITAIGSFRPCVALEQIDCTPSQA